MPVVCRRHDVFCLTVELTRRREFIQPSPDQASYKARNRRSRPTNCSASPSFENSSDIVCSLNRARDTTPTKPLTVIINAVASVTRSPTRCTEWASRACSYCCSRADEGTCTRGPLSLNVRCVSRVGRYSERSTTRTPLPIVVLNGMSNPALRAKHSFGQVITSICVHWSSSPANAWQTPNG